MPPAYEERDIAGRVVLITGASRGLGHFIACRLAERGAKIVAVARSLGDWVASIKERAAHGATVDAIACDISSAFSVRALFQEMLPGLGISKIDVLLNNAGIMPCIFADPLTTPDALEEQTLRINVEGTHFVTKYALPLLVRSADAVASDPFERTVVFMGSAAGWLTEPEAGNGMLAYHASKAAVHGLCVHLHQTFDAPLTEGSMTASVRAGRSVGRIAVADPGFVATQLGKETLPPGTESAKAYESAKPGFGAVSIEEGADTPLWLILARDGQVQGGKGYYRREVHSF